MDPCNVSPSYTHTPIPTMDRHVPTTGQNQNLANSSLRQELQRLPKFSPKCCIYRVPRHLKMVSEGAYTPLVVSIGPLHHHEEHLLPTEIHKRKYLESFLNRSQNNKTGHDLEYYLEIVRTHKEEIRGYYADPVVAQVETEEFIKMVLVDAAFLIELFSRSHNTSLIKPDDQMFLRPRMVVEVSHDICLEENQLPFFILCKLYDASGLNQPERESGTPGGTAISFVDIARQFLRIKSKRISTDETPYTYKHLVDLLRFDFLPSDLRDPRKGGNPGNINGMVDCKSATALREAGVKFKSIKLNNLPQGKLLDIKFDPVKGLVSIPNIVVQDDTEAMFKNIAVFEQYQYFDDTYIIDYIVFMGFLIKTPDDVALLVKEGIIENWLGSNEMVAELFQGLAKSLRLRADKFYYANQSRQLDEHYNHEWVVLRRVLNHPWAKISVVYAVVILLLTVEQAITAAISIMSKR